jgi:hypothetical protein
MPQQMEAKNFGVIEASAHTKAHRAKVAAKMGEYRSICVRYGIAEKEFPNLDEEKRGDCLTEFRCLLPSGKYRDVSNRSVYLESIEFVHEAGRVIECAATYHDGVRRVRIPIDAFIALRGFVHVPDPASL